MRKSVGFSVVVLGLVLVITAGAERRERVGTQSENMPAAVRSGNERKPTGNSSNLDSLEDGFEHKIAALNAGGRIGPADPAIDIFAGLLDKIERKTKNSPQEITDMTIRAQQVLEETGTTMSLLEIMRNLDKSMPDNVEDDTFDYSEIATAFLAATSLK